MEYGEIRNINTGNNGANRIGDYGLDEDKNQFTYTKEGWKPINPDAYEAKFWKKKYEQLNRKYEQTGTATSNY